MVLLSPTAEGLREKRNLLNKYCKDWCLKFNTQKTKVGVNNNSIECVKQKKN